MAMAGVIWAQERPAFEVASVKANPSGEGSFSIDIAPSGRLTVRNMTLWNLIRSAYKLRDGQLAGGPPWIKTQGFDIQAKPPGEQPVAGPEVWRMAQTLLVERFQLKSHRETREQPGYELVVDSRGAKLAPAGEGRALTKFGDLNDPKMTMESLCQIIEFDVARPVINKTGLTGPYAIKLQWASDRAPKGEASADSPLPSLFTAIRETLGLKLENARVPVEVMVIESAERPAGN
jgi:uncharacterized protein (TIGR03435 family)